MFHLGFTGFKYDNARRYFNLAEQSSAIARLEELAVRPIGKLYNSQALRAKWATQSQENCCAQDAIKSASDFADGRKAVF